MRVRLALVGVMIVLIGVACSNAYDNQPITYHPLDAAYVKPRVYAMNVRKIQVNEPGNDALCAIGVTAAGLGAVAAVAAAPVGLTAWATFGYVAGNAAAGWGLGTTLAFCWDQYNQEREVFDVFTACPSTNKILQSSFDDYLGVIAFVNMDACYCSLSCQAGVDDPSQIDPVFKLWPGMMLASQSFNDSKHYWHAGANHVNRAETEPPPPPDFNAMAASMGLEYGGCSGVGVYETC